MKKPDKLLLVKYLLKECLSSESQEVELWLNESDENKAFFRDFERVWQSGGNVKKYFKSVDLTHELNRFHASLALSEKNNKRIRMSNFLKIAAGILLILNGVFFYNLLNTRLQDKHASFTEMIVPNGSKSRITLPDGSIVWLNSGSKLRYESEFNRKIREVKLEGEGYFAIAKDKSRPFVVKTSKLSIRALGTEFNVKSYPGEGIIETTLVKGMVQIQKETEPGSEPESIVLKPNQKMTFIKKTGKIYDSVDIIYTNKEKVINKDDKLSQAQPISERKEKLLVHTIDTDPVIAWKSDKLVFENAPFSEVIVKLERWFGVEIVVNNDMLLQSHYTGRIENETLNDVLQIIRFTMPFEYKVEHKKIFIRKREN